MREPSFSGRSMEDHMLRHSTRLFALTGLFSAALAAFPAPAHAQESARAGSASADYVIGVEDQLAVSVWKELDLNLSVIVRPDGKISFPLVKDLQAAGKTPQQLGQVITEALAKYIKEPIVTVIVQQINSFKVYVLGEVAQQGEFVLRRRTRLLHVIALAGGLTPYSSKNIVLVRDENGRDVRSDIDYRKVINGDRPELNVFLKPGDTILVN